MPFGLKKVSFKFQHQMDEVYALLHPNCFIYINDVFIFSKIVKEHKQHLRRFQKLTDKHRLVLLESKKKIGLSNVDFLHLEILVGKIVSQNHIVYKIREFLNKLKGKRHIQ